MEGWRLKGWERSVILCRRVLGPLGDRRRLRLGLPAPSAVGYLGGRLAVSGPSG